jgi:hypothetical protein
MIGYRYEGGTSETLNLFRSIVTSFVPEMGFGRSILSGAPSLT